MSTVVLSLFGDEIIPEQINAVGKSRAARKTQSAPKKEETETEVVEPIPEIKHEEAAPAAQVAITEPEITGAEFETPSVDNILPVVEAAQVIEEEIEAPEATIQPEVVPEQVKDVLLAIEIVPGAKQEIVDLIIERTPIEPERMPVETTANPVDPAPIATFEQPLSIAEVIPERVEAVSVVIEGAPEVVKTTRRPAAKKAGPAAKKTAVKKEVVKREKPEGHIILEGWTPDKQYYSIGEVAGLFYVATSHIRFWTNEFALKVRTTRKGDRLYSPEQINELRTIYHLVKEKGYTIAGAKARLKEAKKTPVHTLDLKQSLLQLRNKLVDIKNQL
ncbi:MerR family transcriptional regulator [Polluticoccus soli]|uniref:MerR family transcriptional regulator n=1 Tax=Polluticoccus soli TaxID=3034150 RepID=UPI0023E144C9|nr:MerR family transcriptional regulator [Flavipsychrobacter sp. JY13-12]